MAMAFILVEGVDSCLHGQRKVLAMSFPHSGKQASHLTVFQESSTFSKRLQSVFWVHLIPSPQGAYEAELSPNLSFSCSVGQGRKIPPAKENPYLQIFQIVLNPILKCHFLVCHINCRFTNSAS